MRRDGLRQGTAQRPLGARLATCGHLVAEVLPRGVARPAPVSVATDPLLTGVTFDSGSRGYEETPVVKGEREFRFVECLGDDHRRLESRHSYLSDWLATGAIAQ